MFYLLQNVCRRSYWLQTNSQEVFEVPDRRAVSNVSFLEYCYWRFLAEHLGRIFLEILPVSNQFRNRIFREKYITHASASHTEHVIFQGQEYDAVLIFEQTPISGTVSSIYNQKHLKRISLDNSKALLFE